MQPDKIEITTQDIEYAEKVILSQGDIFDVERRNFISDLRTLDLQAVPGSGKTTALLAKLLILEKYLPFNDGSGVLVVSHTNNAVDEIKNKIGKYAPRLFLYPNYVGTIQGFVDRFLAIPFYSNKYNKRPIRIDNETYCEHHYIPRGAWGWLNNRADNLLFNIRLIGEDELIIGFPGKQLPLGKQTPTYRAILKLKSDMVERGYLCFDDAYILAFQYILQNPRVRTILQKRFRFIFVDEMQDMDTHQHDILEQLFFDNGRSRSTFQRIGDKNQAIFSGEIKLGNIWKDRDIILTLRGSYRLNPKIANVINSFALSPIEIEGRKKNRDGSDILIMPHVIVFDDASRNQVIQRFSEIIRSLQSTNEIPSDPDHEFKAIAWRKEHEESEKLGLKDYYPTFEEQAHKPTMYYETLANYLIICIRGNQTLEVFHKNILNAFLKILRLENITDGSNRAYTKQNLFNHLKDNYPETYESLKLKLYQWSIGLVRGEFKNILSEIRAYIPQIVGCFAKTISEARAFINNDPVISSPAASGENSLITGNVCKINEIKIEVSTVHSSKGQTHTATLYLETYYYVDGKGINAKSYESQRLAQQFKNNPMSETAGVRVKHSARMVYVGISRPTHLLCFAVHKDRFERYLNDLDETVWKIERM